MDKHIKKVSFAPEKIMFFIEYKKTDHIVAVLDQLDDIVFGYQVYPARGQPWTCSIKDVQEAYKNSLIDFTNVCHLLDKE